jgi:hypothetical protein
MRSRRRGGKCRSEGAPGLVCPDSTEELLVRGPPPAILTVSSEMRSSHMIWRTEACLVGKRRMPGWWGGSFVSSRGNDRKAQNNWSWDPWRHSNFVFINPMTNRRIPIYR